MAAPQIVSTLQVKFGSDRVESVSSQPMRLAAIRESAMVAAETSGAIVMRANTLLSACFIAALTLALPACQTPSGGPPPAPSPEQAATGVTPSTFRMPSGSGCSGEVERFQAVIDNDLATGHTTKGVHSRVSSEISSARSSCAAGNESGAIGQIRATKARFGYPA